MIAAWAGWVGGEDCAHDWRVPAADVMPRQLAAHRVGDPTPPLPAEKAQPSGAGDTVAYDGERGGQLADCVPVARGGSGYLP